MTRNPRVAHLASAALPAAGALTSQAAHVLPIDVTEATCWVTYTRGAAGGYCVLVPKFSNGAGSVTGEEGTDVLADVGVTAAQPYGTQQLYAAKYIAPKPQDGNAITFCVPIRVPAGATKFRLLAAEAGDTANPGTCAIAIATGTAA